jgi:KaiC/GvpD/RAD55 family RecA-like ATPase
MTKQNNLVKSHISEYLTYLNPSLKIKSTSLFECPICHSQKESCKIYSQFGYKVTCFKCGELGNIFDIFRKCEPDMASLDDNQIAEYLAHLLDIKENVEVDKLLEQYYNSGFHLIPLCANDPSKTDAENAKLQKSPIQGESWKKNTCHDIRKWKEWVEAGLGLALVGGKISNVILLDIDTKTIPEDIKPLLSETLIQDTKRGTHFIFDYDADFDNVNHSNFRGKGYKMEIRVNNSYIVIAPTIVEGYTRIWNNKKIEKMSDGLKKFLLDLVAKDSKQDEKTDSDKEILEAIENEDLGIKNGLKGLDGECNDAWIKIGGVLRKKMSISQVEWALTTFNKLLEHPQQKKAIKAMTYQLAKYDTFDKKDLAKEILEHLQLESVRFANTLDLTKSLGYERKDIEHALDYLVKEQKVVRIGKHFKALNKIEWDTAFMGLSKSLEFEIPYFEKYAKLENSSMVIIGGRTGHGKTHLAMNFIKEFVDRGIKPYYLCTEAGSKFSLVGASLGLKEGDYNFKIVSDATSVEFEDNSVVVIDWIRPGDYSKVDQLMSNLNNQLIKHGGLLIGLVQVRKDGTFFAPDLFDFYASLVANYTWGRKYNDKTKETIYDNENTCLEISKVRDSKLGIQYFKIPTFFNKETKRITLRTGEVS